VLSEDALQGDYIRLVGGEQQGELLLEGGEPKRRVELGGCAEDTHVDQGHPTARSGVDDPHPAAGESGVNTEDAHRVLVVLVELGRDLGAEVQVGENVLHVVAVI
jgi:hypothetical protein